MKQPFDRAGVEPSLDEMFADPVVRLVMRRDGLSDADVWRVVRHGQVRLGVESRSAGERLCTWPQGRPVDYAVLKCA
jgi:hypothetical protein